MVKANYSNLGHCVGGIVGLKIQTGIGKERRCVVIKAGVGLVLRDSETGIRRVWNGAKESFRLL